MIKQRAFKKYIFKKRSLDDQKRQAASSVLHICDPPFNWNFFFLLFYVHRQGSKKSVKESCS